MAKHVWGMHVDREASKTEEIIVRADDASWEALVTTSNGIINAEYTVGDAGSLKLNDVMAFASIHGWV